MARLVRLDSTFLGPVALFAVIVVGAALRLSRPEDMEYKADEIWTFTRVEQLDSDQPIPRVGMTASIGIANPGLSVWVFLVLGKLFAVHDPIALARAVQLVNIAAILLLVGFAWWMVPADEREPWLWAAALIAVNPFTVLLHRKIWAQSMLPFFCMIMLIGWWRRDRRWGAFVWGLVATCLGQIHLSGFFYAAGFFLWGMLFDRGRIRWLSWLLGCLLGVVPMIPWLHYLATEWLGQPLPAGESHWPTVWLWVYWITDALGLGLEYALGVRHYADFLRYPLLNGQPTHLVWLLHCVLIVMGVTLLVRLGYFLWRDRQHLTDHWIGRQSGTAFTIAAALWGYGLLYTATRLDIARHYLAITFPLEFVWLARVAWAGSETAPRLGMLNRLLLITLVITELLLTLCFLDYIHVNQGAPEGGYGVAYGAQQR